MTLRTWMAPVALLGLVACADADGDGLSDAREARLGSDPEIADTDGDGMNDGDEVRAGVDPVLWDTDGDGYSDFQEIDFGCDPLDAESGVYAGGWPYNPWKDDIVDPGLDGHPSLGEPIGRFFGVDQFGEEVDLYDYGGQGKPIMIDISALWCPPCRQLANWVDGGAMGGMQSYTPVREAVENGDLLWVTIISEDLQGGWPDESDIEWWYERFPNENVAILADTSDQDMVGYFNLRFWPSLYLVDENLELIRGPSTQSWTPALGSALQIVREGE